MGQGGRRGGRGGEIAIKPWHRVDLWGWCGVGRVEQQCLGGVMADEWAAGVT